MKPDKERLKLILKKIGLTIIYVIELKISYKSTGLMFINELNNYNKVITDYVDMLEEHNIENPVDVFNCFNQTLWNGYFSANQSFSYELGRKLYFDNYGLGCISGEAVCLNNAAMLTDVFKSLGYEASTLNCCIDPEKMKLDLTDIPIERDIKTGTSNNFYKMTEIIGKIFSNITGNHAITVVKYKDELYYFDPTNLCYFGKTNNNQLTLLNGEGTIDIKYLSSIILGNLDFDTLLGECADYANQIENSKYLDEEVLEEFYEKEKELYLKIKKGCEHKSPLIFSCCVLFCLMEIRCAIYNQIKSHIEHKKRKENDEKLNNEIEKLKKDIEEFKKQLKKINYN